MLRGLEPVETILAHEILGLVLGGSLDVDGPEGAI